MRVSFHPDYRVDLGPTHPFPMGKYPLLHGLLLDEGLIRPADVMQPDEAPLAALARVHSAQYLAKLDSGSLSDAEVRRLGLRWSAHLWRRSRLAAQGTCLAARAALEDGRAANLAGGTHHAYPDHGEGFCVLNDVAVAIAQLRADGRARRALVIDLDVHQGNGTAAIFRDDPEVYTLSLHGARNYPSAKESSSADIALADGTGDAAYLEALGPALSTAIARARADIAFYIAGVDVVGGDRYGRLALSVAGLRAREHCVLEASYRAGLALAITLGGGYAATPLATAQLHMEVFRAAAERGDPGRATLAGPPA